jgi:diguanylate cyclase (GGDEF)-like protein/PAS domain S-box-containing protein
VADSDHEAEAYRAEIVRLSKVNQVLMNRAERGSNVHGSDFSLFQTAIRLEEQVRRRSEALAAALRENEKITRGLRESDAKFRGLISQSLVGIAITEDGRFSYTNAKFDEIFGYCSDEIRKLGPLDLTAASGREIVAEQSLRCLSGELDQFVYVGRGLRKDGSAVHIEIHGSALDIGGKLALITLAMDVTAREAAEQRIMQLACRDGLTGLANRGVFVDALKQAIARADRGDKGFALLYLDLDHFKDVNDTLGHPAGDLLLKFVAKQLQASVRATDTVARFGGDEFSVIAADVVEPADAALLANRLLRAISKPFSVHGNEICSGASIGIAVFGSYTRDPESLLSHADMALYRAKAEGRGTYRFFTDAMDTEVRARVTLGAELREAVAAGQLFLVYQPQVETATGRITGLEALVRWRHPRLGIVGPCEFIPVAESAGLIVALGEWVLREACRQTKAWLDAGIAPEVTAVNLSAHQFKTPEKLESDIVAILADAGLPPRYLALELTESVLMEASRVNNDVLLRLRERGLRIAIDDFGTGYSSLDYLRRFPVDQIKIDKSFIVDLATKPSNAAIVKAAIGLARELNIDVLTEGVETAEQLELLKKWGCREVQGYYFARPMPVEDVAKLLRAGRIFPERPTPVEVAR